MVKRWRIRRGQRGGPAQFVPRRGMVTRFRSLRWRKTIVLLVFLIGGGWWAVWYAPYFQVNTVLVNVDEGDVRVTRDELLPLLQEQLIGQRMIRWQYEQVRQEIRTTYPAVASIHMSRRFPHTMVVSIRERTPVLRLQPPEGGDLLVDASGFVFASASHEGLPPVPIITPVALYDTVESIHLTFLLELFQYIDVTTVTAVSFGVDGTVQLEVDGVELLFSLHTSASRQVDTLSAVYAHYATQRDTLKTVDVRFSRPVVSFK